MTQTRAIPAQGPYPRMTYEEYLRAPDIDEHTEWVDGEVIPMMSGSDAHARLTAYLVRLLGNYLEDRGLGEVFTEPFNMKLEPGSPDALQMSWWCSRRTGVAWRRNS